MLTFPLDAPRLRVTREDKPRREGAKPGTVDPRQFKGVGRRVCDRVGKACRHAVHLRHAGDAAEIDHAAVGVSVRGARHYGRIGFCDSRDGLGFVQSARRNDRVADFQIADFIEV